MAGGTRRGQASDSSAVVVLNASHHQLRYAVNLSSDEHAAILRATLQAHSILLDLPATAESARATLLGVEPLMLGDPSLWTNKVTMLPSMGRRDRDEADYRSLLTSAGFHLNRVTLTGTPVCIIEGIPV